jgi:hypothetical protein
VLQGLVREGAKPIVPASRARHYVEQVASSEAGKNATGIKNMEEESVRDGFLAASSENRSNL